MTRMKSRVKALSLHLECDESEIEVFPGFSVGDREYLVLTDKEANDKTIDDIEDHLWAFNAQFMADETGIDRLVFVALQESQRCESNNEAVRRLVGSRASFLRLARSAIKCDGRGHFLSGYDGGESESVAGGVKYYIYRTN